MSEEVVKKEALKKVFSAILSAPSEKMDALVDELDLQELVEAAKKHDIQKIYFSLTYKFNLLFEAILKNAGIEDSDLCFLMQHGNDFVEDHFADILRTHEGIACSTDKARYLTHGLIKYFSTGEEIDFKPAIFKGDKYSFHIPKKIFTKHVEVLSFYNGIKGVFYGNIKRFCAEIGELYKRCSVESPVNQIEK
jgi:hypothetical protein